MAGSDAAFLSGETGRHESCDPAEASAFICELFAKGKPKLTRPMRAIPRYAWGQLRAAAAACP